MTAVGTLLVTLIAVPAGQAISRSAAERVALQVLEPGRLAGDVVLFGLPGPLRAGAVVNEYGTGTRLSKRGAGKAWLFWLDLEPGASFDHASRVLLVADRTGKVLANRALRTFPLVDGNAPAFLSSTEAYWGDRLHVYSNELSPAPLPPTPPRTRSPPPLASRRRGAR